MNMNAEILQTPQLSTSRLLLLGAASVVLCVSFIVSVFAPFPIALAIILYGRTKGYLTGLLGLAVTYAISTAIYSDLTLFGFYLSVFIFGAAIAEIVSSRFSPIKGLVIFGLAFFVLLGGAGLATIKSQNLTPKEFIVEQITKNSDKLSEQKKIIEQSGSKDSVEVLQILDRPELMADEIIASFPSYLFIGIFIMLWFNMFIVLKSRRLLLPGQDFPFSEKDLIKFKVPFGFVIILAVGLAVAVWGKELGVSENIGFTIIKCLGLFYFFQGFGVFSDLLSFLGIVGFFRSLIVIGMVFMANYLIAAAGLFDNWFDFRKYFNKPKFEE